MHRPAHSPTCETPAARSLRPTDVRQVATDVRHREALLLRLELEGATPDQLARAALHDTSALEGLIRPLLSRPC